MWVLPERQEPARPEPSCAVLCCESGERRLKVIESCKFSKDLMFLFETRHRQIEAGHEIVRIGSPNTQASSVLIFYESKPSQQKSRYVGFLTHLGKSGDSHRETCPSSAVSDASWVSWLAVPRTFLSGVCSRHVKRELYLTLVVK